MALSAAGEAVNIFRRATRTVRSAAWDEFLQSRGGE
jgi:hypothetical protein